MFKIGKKLPKFNELKKLSPISLKEVLDTAIERGVIIYAEDVIKLRNKMLGYKGAELKKKNKEDYIKVKKEWYASENYKKRYEEIQNKRIEKKLKKVHKQTGVQDKAGKLVVFGIPRQDIMSMSYEDYVEGKIAENNAGPKKDRLAESTIRQRAKKEYNYARDLARSDKLNDIDKYSLNYTHDFIDTYFKYSTRPDLVARVKEYTKHLSVQQRYDFMETLASDTFRQIYGSDEDGNNYIEMSADERAEKRLNDAIKILRNETGLNVRANKTGTKITSVTESKAKRRKGGKWSFSNFI